VSYFLAAEAEAELAEAMRFYAEQAGRPVALAFLLEFTRAAELLASNPGLGTPTLRERRVFPLRRFPYSLIYRADPDGIRIGAVAHHSRRPGYWRARG
jgi:plasmid stabilization system protein ParE